MNEITRPQPTPVHGVAGYKWVSTQSHGHHEYNVPGVLGLLPKKERPLRILDAGCGNGFLASAMSKRGHEVIGIDISAEGVQLARSSYPDLRFECRSVLEDLSNLAPIGGFDAIVSTEVIEHLYSPEQFLEGVYRNLGPGGVAVLTTPYYGYVKNLAIALTNSWDRHHMVHFEGGHIKLFSRATLSKMMERIGFRRIQFKGVGRTPLLWKSMILLGHKD